MISFLSFVQPTSLSLFCSNNRQLLSVHTVCDHCLRSELWNTLTANALIKAGTWSFALMVPPTSLAQRCVSIPSSNFSIPDFIFIPSIEHECRWTLQQDWENGGFETTHLLQQRHWHICETFLEICQLSHASRQQQHRSRYCLVRIIGFRLS